MKPGTIGRPNLNTRRSKSLCNRNEMPGKKEIGERKSLYKASHSVLNITQSNLNQGRGIPKPIQNGLSNPRSSHAHKGISSKCGQTKGKFLRPQIDMLAARKRMFERMLHLKQISGKDAEDKKSDFDIVQKLNFACTPKQSALTKVYLKLSESAKKSAKSRSLFPAVPTSPFTEEVLHGKSNLNATAAVNNSFDLKNGVESKKPSIPCTSKVDQSHGIVPVVPESEKEILANVSDLSDRASIKNIGYQSSKNCALNNILKHCQLYCTKISSIIDAITCLDDSFQRVMVGGIGGHVYSNFCEYQRKKLNLYREMKLIEEELEDAVKNELDVKTKFQDYLKKKMNIWREESDLLEEFKSTVNCLIDKYEEQIVKPPDNKNLQEVVQMLSSSTISKKEVSNEEPILRRSQRLLTPRRVQTTSKSCRVLRSSRSEKLLKESDDLVIKRNTKSNEKRCIQRSIYKDLQKSFNLYSPECSF